MVIDTSALVAILFGEPEADRFARVIADDDVRLVPTASLLETSIVVESELGEAGGRELDFLVLTTAIEIVPFTLDHLRMARHAYRMFGKGRHPAGLNFGDCFAYALSRTTGEPLLFKGVDFSRTDISPAL